MPEPQRPEQLEHTRERRFLQTKAPSFYTLLEGRRRGAGVLWGRAAYLAAFVPHLRYSVGRGVHELGQVHHTLPLVLGDVDALDRGEAGVGVPEVLQLELPLRQPRPRQLHKHLWRQWPAGGAFQEPEDLTNAAPARADVTLCLRRTMSWERRIRPQSLAGWRAESQAATLFNQVRRLPEI